MTLLSNYYNSHFLVPQIALNGHKELCKTKALIIGAGGLASGVIPSLVGSGINYLRIMDGDIIEESNLHRQFLYDYSHIGIPKAYIAANFVKKKNYNIKTDAINEYLSLKNYKKAINGINIIFDCSDNLQTRRLISDISELHKIDVISGCAIGTNGQVLIYGPNKGSYRSLVGSQYSSTYLNNLNGESNKELFKKTLLSELNATNANCSSAGIFGPIPLFIGTLMANEGIKILLNKSMKYNFISYSFDEESKPIRHLTLSQKANEKPITDFIKDDYIMKKCQASNNYNIDLLTWSELKDKLAKNIDFLIIDIRPGLLYESSNYQNSISIPFSNFIALMFEDVNNSNVRNIRNIIGKHKNIAVYCQKGITSAKLVDYLNQYFAIFDEGDKEQFSRMKIYSIASGFSSFITNNENI